MSILILLAIGSIGGFLSGLLGIGGGIIFVPALYFYFIHSGIDIDVAMHAAIGTSLMLVFVTGLSSSFWHKKKGAVDLSLLKRWAPAIAIGLLLGLCVSHVAHGLVLKKIFAAATLLISVYMMRKKKEVGHAAHRVSLGVQWVVAGIIGFFAALIGVGGAILGIPFMSYIGVPTRTTIGTGAAMGGIISLPSAIGYAVSGQLVSGLPPYSLGYVNLLAAIIIIPCAMALSYIGTEASHRLPKETLRRIFAVVLIFVALRMFMT
jgi:uncharacterized protein